MKCKKLTIETNGTSAGTKIMIDGEQIGLIQVLELEIDCEKNPIRIMMKKARIDKTTGKPNTKILKLRDENTMKFVEKEVIESDPISLEFEAFTTSML